MISWDNVTHTATVAANDYTDTDGSDPPSWPGSDAAAFVVGYLCDVWTADMDTRRTDDAGTRGVVQVGTNTLRFDAEFATGGVPFVLVAGDIITFAGYDLANTAMRNYGFISDAGVDPHPGSSSDTPYVWGD